MTIRSLDPQDDAFDVAVHSVNASGYPSTRHASLMAPASFAAGNVRFTAPAGTSLAPNSTYTIVVKVRGGISLTLATTTSDAQDAANGWSIADSYDFKSGGNWTGTTTSRTLKIEIEGEAYKPPAPQDLTATASNGRAILDWERPDSIQSYDNYLARYEYQQKAGNGNWGPWKYASDQYVTGLVVSELTNGTKYSFRVRAVYLAIDSRGGGTEEIGQESSIASTSPAPQFRLSLSSGGVRSKGDPVKATMSITDGYVLDSAQTFDLTWGTSPVNAGQLHADNPTTITLPAGDIHASIELRAWDGKENVYANPTPRDLEAKLGNTLIGTKKLTVYDNDDKPQASLTAANTTVEEGSAITLTVTLTHGIQGPVWIPLGVTNPNNRALTGVPATIKVDAEQLSKSVEIQTTDNNDKDSDDTLTFLLTRQRDDPWLLWSNAVEVTVQDDDTPDSERRTPTLSVGNASTRESGEGTDTEMTFTVRLEDHRINKRTVTVGYRTVDGTATAGSDYTATSGTLTFAPGDESKQVRVTVKDDTVEDSGETFELVLENPTGGAQLDRGKKRATGTIRNTEAPELSATFPASAYASGSHTGEDDRPQVVVTFSEAVASFEKDTPSVSVTGATVTSVQTHTENGLENAHLFFLTPDGDEGVTFTLVADAACGTGGICTAAGTPLTEVPGARTIPGPAEPEATEVSELSASDAEASEEDDSTLDFVVKLDPASSESVSVDYATTNGTASAGDDYTGTSGTLTFAAGETSKTVGVPIIDDTIDDDNETLMLRLSNASGADIKDAQATGTIRDSEAAADPLTASFKNMPSEHDGNAAFTFQVEFSEDVGISYATLRDDSFTVGEGDITGARHVDGRNDLWEITVEPESRADVTVTAPRQPGLQDHGRCMHPRRQPAPTDQQPVGDGHRTARRAADGELQQHARRARRQRVHLRSELQRERQRRVRAHP